MEPEALGWWTISGEALLEALQQVHDGDLPDVVYAEMYANSTRHRYDEDGVCLYHEDCTSSDE